MLSVFHFVQLQPPIVKALHKYDSKNPDNLCFIEGDKISLLDARFVIDSLCFNTMEHCDKLIWTIYLNNFISLHSIILHIVQILDLILWAGRR